VLVAWYGALSYAPLVYLEKSKMRLNREEVSVFTLNTTPELVKIIEPEETKDPLEHIIVKAVDCYRDNVQLSLAEIARADNVRGTLYTPPSGSGKTITMPGYNDEYVYMMLDLGTSSMCNRLHDDYRRDDGDRAGSLNELAKLVTRAFRKEYKINKNNTLTMANFIRLVARLRGMTITEAELKNALTQVNKQKKYYLYKTQKYVAEHYATLSNVCSLTSCMTKGAGDLPTKTHNVPCDKALATSLGAQTSVHNLRGRGDEDTMFTPNVDGYSGGSMWLGLLSEYSPEELKKLDSYGFSARVIIYQVDGEWCHSRAYGKEYAVNLISRSLRSHHAGGQTFRAYLSPRPWISENFKTPRYITPYIDGTCRHFKLSDEDYKDEYGRVYKIATVLTLVSGNYPGGSMGDAPRKDGIYRTAQSLWLTEEEYWSDQCVLSNSFVERGNGRWSKTLNGYISLEYGTDDSQLDILIVGKAVQKRYDKLSKEINDTLQEYYTRVKKVRDTAAYLGIKLNETKTPFNPF
jgi:hypothetical protein